MDSRIIFMRRTSFLLLVSTAVLWLILVDNSKGSSASTSAIRVLSDSVQPFKPKIYTFQEFLPSPDQVHPELLLWQLSWKQAGWDAKVITFDDALRHPNFDTFERALSEIMPFGRRPEKMGYYRYLAMAVTGGGFLADVDVLPIWQLSLSQRETVNQDDFVVRCGSAKLASCLMSGSGEEWNRISIELLSSIQRHYQAVYHSDVKIDNPDSEIPVWNNIYALQDVVSFGNSHGRPMARMTQQVLSARQAYDVRKHNSFSEQQCNEIKDRLAVQFSATLMEDMKGTLDAPIHWLEQWKRDCARAPRPIVPAGAEIPGETTLRPKSHLELAATPLGEASSASIPPARVARLLVRNK